MYFSDASSYTVKFTWRLTWGFQGDFLGLSKLPEVKRPSSLLLEPNTNQVRFQNYWIHRCKQCVCRTVINPSFLVWTAHCAQPGRVHWPGQVQAWKEVECPSAPQVDFQFNYSRYPHKGLWRHCTVLLALNLSTQMCCVIPLQFWCEAFVII